MEIPSGSRDRSAPPDHRSWWSRVVDWFLLREPEVEPPDRGSVERPWRHRWDHLPKRTAGIDFTRNDYRAARRRAGFLDVPSRLYPGITYRLRVGRRIEVRCEPGVVSPWRFPYLCINPTYRSPRRSSSRTSTSTSATAKT